MATLGGADIFGQAVRVNHSPLADAEQVNAFFGTTGVQSVYGGGRGRVFEVRGLLVGESIPAVIAAEDTLLSYVDGIARDFVDNDGRTWPSVKFNGEYKQDPGGIMPCTPYGYCRGYSLVLRGLR